MPKPPRAGRCRCLAQFKRIVEEELDIAEEGIATTRHHGQTYNMGAAEACSNILKRLDENAAQPRRGRA